jgi:phosphohistidine phosphatase
MAMAGRRTLYLLRHAKSSWDDPSLADHDRPLAPRGRRNAAALADHLEAAGIAPRLILCSPARRARETLAGILPALDAETDIRIEDGLYGASAVRLLDRLREVPAGTVSAMVVAHNPGLEELAARLDESAGGGPFPTGALATFTLDDWPALGPGGAALTARWTPRQGTTTM